LCRLQNRSLLSVNEDFEGKRNTEIYFLVTPFMSIYRIPANLFHKYLLAVDNIYALDRILYLAAL